MQLSTTSTLPAPLLLDLLHLLDDSYDKGKLHN